MSIREYETNETQPQVGFRISSRVVADLLVDRYGIPPNKSNIDPPFPSIPDEWLSHFTRGEVDGDGCIIGSNNDAVKINIVGSHRFIKELVERVAKVAGVRVPTIRTIESSEKISSATWYSISEVSTLLNWMYPPGEYLHLIRKRRKANIHLQRSGLRISTDLRAGEGG